MSKNLSIKDNLAYMGVGAPTPPNFRVFSRAPLTTDYRNFNLGDIWLQKNTINLWMLTDKQINVATWTDISTGGAKTVTSLTVTPGDITVTDGNIYINTGSLILGAINYPSTLRTDATGIVYGLADAGTPGVGEGIVYHTSSAGITQWGTIVSAAGTVTITTTASGINLEAAGGTGAATFTTDLSGPVTPTVGGNLFVLGNSNIYTDGSTLNTVLINLEDNIALTAVNVGTAAASLELSGTTLAAWGTDADIDINITPKGSGVLATGDVTAGNVLVVGLHTGTVAAGLDIGLTNIIAAGTDADINISITPQGTGTVIIPSVQITDFTTGTLRSDATGIISSLADDATPTRYLANTGGAGAAKWDQVDLTNGVTGVLPTVNGGAGPITINEQTGATYTLALTDAFKQLRFTNAAPVTVTVPTNAAVAFPIGTYLMLVQYGAGAVTITNAVGVTIYSCAGRLSLYERYSAACLKKENTDEWILMGDIK